MSTCKVSEERKRDDLLAKLHHTMEEIFRMDCLRWRSERNFWMSGLSLMLWLLLYRIRALIKQVHSTVIETKNL